MVIKQNYYKVNAKCGHVGRENYVIKTFAIKAESGKLAAAIVRNWPRVKHHHKDAIMSVVRIDFDEYSQIIETNMLDPYFSCVNVQEQRMYCEPDIQREESKIYKTESESISRKKLYNGKTHIKKPKKYLNMNLLVGYV